MTKAWSLVPIVALLLATSHAGAAVVICSTKKGKLTLRADACKAKETVVDAAELGVAGPKGDEGDQGAPGAPGTNGAPGQPGVPGLSGLEVVTAQTTSIQTGTVSASATASCPAGKKVLGGGGEFVFVAATPTDVRTRSSAPVTTDPQGWRHEITVEVNDDWAVRSYAICADVTP